MRTKPEQRAKILTAVILKSIIAQNVFDKRQKDIPSFACGFNGLKIEFFIFWLANLDKINLD